MPQTRQELQKAGLDDPQRQWLQQVVRVKTHPEWGLARVLRWYPAQGDQPESLRLMATEKSAPQVVWVADVEILAL